MRPEPGAFDAALPGRVLRTRPPGAIRATRAVSWTAPDEASFTDWFLESTGGH